MSSQVSTMPAARATAIQWMVWLVEPPVAISATMALTIARSSIRCPMRAVVVAQRGDAQRALGGGTGQCIAQRRARIDEGRARQLQAHRLQQHLVGIGGAVEGAGAGCVVGSRFRFQQFLARRLAGGVALAHLGLLLVRDAGRHRTGRARTPPAGGRRRGRRSAGRARSCRRHRGTPRRRTCRGDSAIAVACAIDVAREQRQLHAGAALGDAVAHRRHAAGDLRGGAEFARDWRGSHRDSVSNGWCADSMSL